MLLLVPPLKVTSDCDVKTLISNWLDEKDSNNSGVGNSHPRPDFRSVECLKDLDRIASLRDAICTVIQESSSSSSSSSLDSDSIDIDIDTSACSSSNMDMAYDRVSAFYDYHAVLVECESRGMCIYEESSAPLRSRWVSVVTKEHEIHNTLTWDRVNVLWNIVALETYQAYKLTSQIFMQATANGESICKPKNKMIWSTAGKHLEKGATILIHLRKDILSIPNTDDDNNNNDDAAKVDKIKYNFTSVEFSPTFLLLWEIMLMAGAQTAAYRAFSCAARPRHFMLAKLAAASIPLYSQCEHICENHDTVTALTAQQMSKNKIQILYQRSKIWALYMKTMSQYHQSCADRDKRQYKIQHNRLQLALQYAASTSKEIATINNNHTATTTATIDNTSLLRQLDDIVPQIRQELEKCQQVMLEKNIQTDTAAVPDIPPQKQVNVNQPLIKILPPIQTPMFTDIMSPLTRRYVNLFITEMDKMVQNISNISEEKSESARKALATVNLPHSLTAYKQEMAGGGIPEDLWRRIDVIQREHCINQLKQDLWELRDIADMAKLMYHRIQEQLDEDLNMENLFRQQYPKFIGHDALEVQKTFRNSLENYDRLLKTARDGDEVLLARFSMLDTDPKYKLLQFQKSQLDRLLPPAMAAAAASKDDPIDTSLLSQLLADLSVLFRERETLITNLREQLESYDIYTKLVQVDQEAKQASSETTAITEEAAALRTKMPPSSPDNDNDNSSASISSIEVEKQLQQVLVQAKESFSPITYDIHDNISRQRDLVRTILHENQNFMNARDAALQHQRSSAAAVAQSPSAAVASASDSCIVMIEVAIEEIDQLSNHLKEGKDFYDVVIPKLEKLQHNVGDVSARLTVERCEYEDRAKQSLQEEEDARIAASLLADSNASSSSTGGGAETTMTNANTSSNTTTGNNDNNNSRRQQLQESLTRQTSSVHGELSQQQQQQNTTTTISNVGANTSSSNVAPAALNVASTRISADNDSGSLGGSGNDTQSNTLPFHARLPSGTHNIDSNWRQRHQEGEQQKQRGPHHNNIHPGVQAVSHNEMPQVRVDDEKVASLVAMDFDPEKVVAALEKYDNNIDRALNELLSC